MPIVLKSGSLKLLEPSWALQACNGIALPLLHIAYLVTVNNIIKTESNAMYAQQCVQGIVVAANIMKHADIFVRF